MPTSVWSWKHDLCLCRWLRGLGTPLLIFKTANATSLRGFLTLEALAKNAEPSKIAGCGSSVARGRRWKHHASGWSPVSGEPGNEKRVVANWFEKVVR